MINLFRYLFILFIAFVYPTFSIVAVDLDNGQVGSAGASCIGGSIIISDIHPGVGAIHTQSYWSGYNQLMASDLMDNGLSPDEIIDYIVENDVSNNPLIRQYGIVDLYEGGRSAAYTGENCMDYKGHILGQTYAIQGNILLSEEVLINMENNFNSTVGTLSDKLMAALQELQKSLNKDDFQKSLEELKNFKFEMEDLENQLDRMIDLFDQVIAEQKLDELVKKLENMKNLQKEISKKINNLETDSNIKPMEKKQHNNSPSRGSLASKKIAAGEEDQLIYFLTPHLLLSLLFL